MATQLTSKLVKIAKPHVCHTCGHTYPVGTIMQKWSSVDCGYFSYGYTCDICQEYISRNTSSWYDYDGYCENSIWENDKEGWLAIKQELYPPLTQEQVREEIRALVEQIRELGNEYFDKSWELAGSVNAAGMLIFKDTDKDADIYLYKKA